MKLYFKLTLAILVLFIMLGGMLIYISDKTSGMYALEITQRINRDVAIHAAEDMPLFKNGRPNEVALKELALHVMMINPIVEVYLLDLKGNVLSHALPFVTPLLTRVSVLPIQKFIDGEQPLPIFGDDPRNPDQRKVFSVSAVKDNGEVAGYLYTILNGAAHDELRRSIQPSSILQSGQMTILASVIVAAIAGFIIFALLTRRLKHLISSIRIYRKNSFKGHLPRLNRSLLKDEIDELSLAIFDMSERIEGQFSALKKEDQTRRDLIANVSHDLRTPLTSLQGYLETIIVKSDTLSQQDKDHYLQTAYKNSRRLNDLISELFELAKLDSTSLEPDWQEFPLMELIQDLVQDCELQVQEKGISLAVQCTDMSISVYADIALIHRVLENLLHNALRHTPLNGEVIFRVSKDDKKVKIEVVDNGDGIASHEIPHIFDRFYQSSMNQTSEGQGLGLAIVKRIIELHQSRVSVQSSPDSGTTFTFWLPHTARGNFTTV